MQRLIGQLPLPRRKRTTSQKTASDATVPRDKKCDGGRAGLIDWTLPASHVPTLLIEHLRGSTPASTACYGFPTSLSLCGGGVAEAYWTAQGFHRFKNCGAFDCVLKDLAQQVRNDEEERKGQTVERWAKRGTSKTASIQSDGVEGESEGKDGKVSSPKRSH